MKKAFGEIGLPEDIARRSEDSLKHLRCHVNTVALPIRDTRVANSVADFPAKSRPSEDIFCRDSGPAGSHAEIANLQAPAFADEDVVWFEVEVDDAHLVNMVDTLLVRPLSGQRKR